MVAGGSIWIANYDPFRPGHIVYHALDTRISTTDISALGAEGRVYLFHASGPARFRYRFTILNDGPVAVRILSLDRSAGAEVQLRPVRVIPDLSVVEDGRWRYEPWHPFPLRPGRDATIEMEVMFTPRSCLDRGTLLGWWPETIRYSVFGIHRTTTFESAAEVRIVGTERCS
jgi:hypothetical protein